MQIESSKADPPKRKRRWFQFSLRTLLIVDTLLGAAWMWSPATARHAKLPTASRGRRSTTLGFDGPAHHESRVVSSPWLFLPTQNGHFDSHPNRL